MELKSIKFNCNDIGYFVSESKHSKYATPNQIEKALKAFDKENYLAFTATDIENLLIVIDKHLTYSADKVGAGTKSFLSELYCKLVFGVGDIQMMDEFSNRKFQINGTKSEKYAIELLSELDGIKYEKNKSTYENDFFIGKPDILLSSSVKEIKTVYNPSNFFILDSNKPPKLHLFQLQTYLDVLDFEEGELVYVLIGLQGEERERYLAFAKERYQTSQLSSQEISTKLKKLEANIDLSHIPIDKRIIRKTFKRNPYMIRLARKKVTAARAFLVKLDAKFNNNVALPDGKITSQAESI